MRKYIIWAVVIVNICLILMLLFFNYMFPLRYKSEIIENANQNNIAPELLAAIINAESGFVPNKISNKGAVGLMQILPTTANYTVQKFGISAAPDLFDPAENIAVGTRYLKYLLDKFGDTTTALFAYNAGEGNVAKWLAEKQTDTLTECPFPETNAYAKKILRSVKFYKFRF
jgi:soluble lytic murein transglycosylase